MSQRIRDPRRSRGISARHATRAVCWFAALLATLGIVAPAHAVNYVWNNAAGGNWGVATNWTPNGVPNATTDTATITLAGTYTVTVNGSFTAAAVTLGGAPGTQTLALPLGSVLALNAGGVPATMAVNANGVLNQGGSLQGGGASAQVTIAGRHDWTTGDITSGYTVTVSAGGTLALATAGSKSLFGPVQLVNNGTITHADGGTLLVENNSTVTNATGGVLDLQADARIIQQGGGTSTLNNAGTLRKSTGAGTSTISLVAFNNTGVVDAQAGTLAPGNPGMTLVASGAGNAFNAQPGAALVIGQVGAASFSGTSFGGGGTKTLGFAGAQYTFAGTITATNTTFTAGTLMGTWTLAGTLGWTGGSLRGSPTIGPGATLAASGSAAKTLQGGPTTLTNSGTLSLTGSENLYVENNALLTNAAGGTIDLQANVGIVQSGGATSVLNNAGTLRKSAGAGTSPISLVSFTNTGTVDAQAGTLSIAHPGMTLQANGAGNAFNAQPGASLNIAPASSATFGGTTFGGAGVKTIGTVGNTTVPHAYSGTIAATNTTIVGGLHWGTFTLNGDLAMSAGVMAQGASFHMTIPAGATFTFTGGGAKQLLGGAGVTARITNGGTLRFSSTSSLQGDNGAYIQNTAGGLIEFLAQGGLGTTGAAGPSVLENLGTVRFAAGATVPVASWSIVNTGTISVQSGLFAWSGVNASFGQTAGRLELVGGNMSNQQHLSISGGVLAGTGTIQGPGAVNLSGTAQTRPGTSPGRITVGGTLAQTGTYIAELNGTTPVTQYDQLVGQGNVTVGGTLTVALGIVPANGTVFTIVDKTSAGPIVGAFGGLPQGAVFTVSGVQLQISYTGGDGNDVTLTVFQNSGLICTPFTDVDQASPFCPSVQWMKDRAITFGITPTLYGPAQETTRAQMALFMNRLGNVLTDAPLVVDVPAVSLTGATSQVVCESGDQAAATYERRVALDAVFAGLGSGASDYGVEIVASVDGGANWIPLAPAAAVGTANGHWSNVRVSGDRDVARTEVVRYGVRFTRTSGASGFGEARCLLRLLTGNRNPSPAPDR